MPVKKWFVVGSVLVFAWSGNAIASFDRELENLNRKRSMQILDEFNEEIDRQIGVADLTPEQIRRSLQAEQQLEAERAAKESETDGAGKKKSTFTEEKAPLIPKEQLKELLGLQMDDAQNENIPLNIRTDIGMTTKRDSNVFERRIDAVGETRFSYYPGVHATTRWLGWDYKTDYTMTRLLHMNFVQNDRIEHKWAQLLSRKKSKTAWRFMSDISSTAIPTESALIKPPRTTGASYGGGVTYALTSKVDVDTSYMRTGTAYMSDTNNALDAQSHSFDLKFIYAMTSKTKFRIGHTFRISRPPKGLKSDNINFYNYYLGLDGRVTDKLFYNLQFGLKYAKRSVEAIPMKEDYFYIGTLTYAYSPKTRFRAYIQRDQVPEVTETESDPNNLLFGFGVTHSLTSKISIGAEESLRLISVNSGTPTTVVEPDYAPSRFTSFRSDAHLTTHVNVAYKIDPLSVLTFDYNYLDVDSNLKLNDRINHTCEVSYVKKF